MDDRQQVLQRLKVATALCSFFFFVEVAGGLLAGSLAILSDAAHLFADLAGFVVAIASTYLASMPATRNHTYGLKRTESLGALFSMASLAFVTVTLAYEAVRRLINPPETLVDGKLMVIIASIGVGVNIALAFVLGENHVHLPGSSHGHAHDHGPAHHGGDDHDEEHGGHDHSHKQHESHDHGHDHSHWHHQQHDHGHDHGHQETHNHFGHGHHDDDDETEALNPKIGQHQMCKTCPSSDGKTCDSPLGHHGHDDEDDHDGKKKRRKLWQITM